MIDSLRTPAIDIMAYATPRTHWPRVDANVSKKSGRAVSGQKSRLWPLFAITAITTIVFMLTGTSAQAQKKYDPGASDAEIKIGQTMPYSGPVSAFSSVARVHQAYYKMINDHGGINGRKITMISLDDGYNPAKTVEQTRRLVEQDEVLALFSSLGTPTGVAARKYLNDKKVPQLLVLSTSSQWNRPREYPYSTSLNLSADQEAGAIGRFILSKKPDAKIGVLYQNDDYGKDYLKGLKEGLGSKADSMIVSALSYLSSDPTLDQQLVALKYSGADVFVNATTGKFSAMSIRKAGELKWKPLQIASTSNLSLKNVLLPAGVENAEGIISLVNYKDPSDPKISNDPDVRAYFDFMSEYLPNEDAKDSSFVGGYAGAQLATYILRKCGDDLTRDNVLKQATTLSNPPIGMVVEGVTISTSPDNYLPFESARLVRFDGAKWNIFDQAVKMK